MNSKLRIFYKGASFFISNRLNIYLENAEIESRKFDLTVKNQEYYTQFKRELEIGLFNYWVMSELKYLKKLVEI